jgi:hypothetical protein
MRSERMSRYRLSTRAHLHAQAAVHLQRHVDHALGVLGGGHLGHRGFGGDAHAAALFAVVAQPGRAVGQQRGSVDQRRHLAQLGLRELEVGQRLAEHRRCLACATASASARRAMPSAAPATEARKMSSVCMASLKPPLSTPSCALAGTRQSVERSVASGCGAITWMCSVTVQARRVRVHDEGGDAARAGRRVGLGEHAVKVGHAAVADPGLGSPL